MVVTCGHNAVRRVYCLASEMASHVFAKLSSAPPFRVRRVLSMIRHPGCASASVHLMHPAVYYAFRFSPLATSDVTRRRWRMGPMVRPARSTRPTSVRMAPLCSPRLRTKRPSFGVPTQVRHRVPMGALWRVGGHVF